MLQGQAICKDCGNGTLNNAINEQFVLCDFNDDGNEVAVCKQCGGTHIDGELYLDDLEQFDPELAAEQTADDEEEPRWSELTERVSE